MVATLIVKQHPSLIYKDREKAEELASKIYENYKYIDLCWVEHINGKELGYGIYNLKSERLIEKEDL